MHFICEISVRAGAQLVLQRNSKLPPLPFHLSDFQGNVEIETYWLKGKRDKDGNAQAACPQFETQTISKAISKATISGPETVEDEEGLVNKKGGRNLQ